MAQSGGFGIRRSKVNQERGFQGKNDIIDNFTFTILDEPDRYGNNVLIFEALTPEEREQGVKAQIVGSGKMFRKK